MIAKGNTHDNGPKLAHYLTNGKKGEKAELWQLRGFAEEDIKDAFRSVHIMAEATRCQQPFFHTQVRNPEGENLTREQWELTADRIEKALGLNDQPRAIAFHRDAETGHEHMHVAWSRIDDETLTAVHMPFFKLRLKDVSRELEKELDLTRVRNHRETPVMAPTRDEDQQARRLNVELRDVRDTIRGCWERSDNGRSFAASLADEGLTLAKGDRRDFVVIDLEGGMHALGKKVLGTTAAETRARMTDLDRNQLPSVEKARELVAETRAVSREAATYAGGLTWQDALEKAAIKKEQIERRFEEPKAPAGIEATREDINRQKAPAKPERELNDKAADIRLAYSLSDSAASFAAAIEERGMRLAIVNPAEAERSKADHAAAEEHGRYSPEYRAGEIVAVTGLGHVYRLDEHTTGDQRGEIEKFLGQLDRSQFDGLELTQQARMNEGHAFMELSSVGLLTNEPDTAPTAPGSGIQIDLGAAVEAVVEAPGKALDVISEIMAEVGAGMKMLGGLAALFGDDKPAPPPTKEIAENMKAANAEARRNNQLAEILDEKSYKQWSDTKERERTEEKSREEDNERGRDRQR